jgi:hypothetical protein
MEMAGTYSPDSYQVQTSMRFEGKGTEAEKGMAMRLRVEAQRIGECSGSRG